MPTRAETLMQEALARLKAEPVIQDTSNIRRDHRTVITRDNAPAVHLIDGEETPAVTTRDCDVDTELTFTLAIFVRDDAGYEAADPIKTLVMAALNPDTAYTFSADLVRGRIRSEQEVADGDALRVDMEFTFKYKTPRWGL